jgi:hypothetical protein
LNFLSDSQDVQPIQTAYPLASDYDAFFIAVNDGEVVELWGIVGTVPYLSKLAKRIV